MKAMGLTMAACGLLWAGQASAQADNAPAPSGPLSISHPDWVRRPNGSDLAQAYPSQAFKQGLGGQVLMSCKVTASGSMSDCSVLREQPEGLGFGQAALSLAPDFKMRRTRVDGQSVEGRTVQIPMRFALARPPPPEGLLPPPLPIPPPPPLPATPPLSIGGASYWEELPQQMARYYPDRAMRMNRSGDASLKCVVTDDGRLNLCEIISETPEDFGFGQAGLQLTKMFKMHPTTTDGRPVGGASVVIRMRFALPQPEPMPPQPQRP